MKINKTSKICSKYNKNLLINIFSKIGLGFFMGISDGIPGYSGGTSLSLFNFYDILMNKIKWLFKKSSVKIWFRNFLSLLPFFISWIVFLICFSFLTSFIAKQGINYELILFFLFFSFSIFCIPIFILKNFYINKNKIFSSSKKNNVIYSILSVMFFVIITSIGIGLFFNGGISLKKNIVGNHIEFNPYTLVILIMCLLSGFCMLIPGISGSLILFLSQTYDDVYWVALQNPLENIGFLILVVIFILIGIGLSILMINFLLKKFYYYFKFASLGLVLGSPIAMALAFFGNQSYIFAIEKMFSSTNISILFFFLVILLSLIVNIIFIFLFFYNQKRIQREFKDLNITSSSALLVVDLQNDFYINGSLEIKKSDEIPQFINRLISFFKINNLKVLYSQDYHPINHCSFQSWPKHCVQNEYGSEFIEFLNKSDADLIVQKGTYIDVDNYSVFYNGHNESVLKEYLYENKIDTLYLVGLAGDYCIRSTALDAKKFKMNVILFQNGIRSVDENFDLKSIDKEIKVIY